jgi:hypothetical protein
VWAITKAGRRLEIGERKVVETIQTSIELAENDKQPLVLIGK